MSAYLQYYFQLTEEKLGTSERTELDAHFENLAERSDSTKLWTEKILSDTEAVLTPNPGLTSVLSKNKLPIHNCTLALPIHCSGKRVEDFLFEKIDKKRPTRLSNLEYLGLDMIDAGNEFGPGTAYGMPLSFQCKISDGFLLQKQYVEGFILVF